MSWLVIFLSGGLGSLARHGISLLIPFGPGAFPWGIFTVNAIGSLLIGVAYGIAGRFNPPEIFLPLVATGFLGGFTTFSSFSWQSLMLIQQGRWFYAGLYVLGSPAAGVICALLGWLAVRRI